MHSEIWQFRWREKTADGKNIDRRRQIGTIDQIPDIEAARKAANLLVPDLNARLEESKAGSIRNVVSLPFSVNAEDIYKDAALGRFLGANWVQNAPKIAPNFVGLLTPNHPVSHLECMAGTTGLEPATSAVTDRK
jgi:hypothetical protein